MSDRLLIMSCLIGLEEAQGWYESMDCLTGLEGAQGWYESMASRREGEAVLEDKVVSKHHHMKGACEALLSCSEIMELMRPAFMRGGLPGNTTVEDEKEALVKVHVGLKVNR